MDTLPTTKKQASFMQETLEDMKAQGSRILPRPNDVVEGRVLRILGSHAFIDLGPLGIGAVGWGEIEFLAARGLRLNPGETIHVNIIDWDDEGGFLKLSVRSAGEEQTWQDIASAFAKGEIVPAKVLSATRGGLVVSVGELEGFLPASQLSDEHYPKVEGGKPEDIQRELSRFVGDTLSVKILSWDRARAKLILSERAVADEEIRAKLERFSVGDVIHGKVQGVVDFGVFVGFEDGLEGLVHISELDWRLIDDPHEIVGVGQEVDAKILGIEGTRVSLSLRALKPNPWEKVGERYEVAKRVSGTVVKLHPFGAFVRLDPDIHGLIHLSEFGGSQDEMKKHLELGKSYQFEIVALESESRRLGLKLVSNESSEQSS